MPISRLFSPLSLASGKTITLDEERARYVTRVLRLRSGDALRVFDGGGGEFDAEVRIAARRAVDLLVGKHHNHDLESPLSVHLVQGVSRGERMDIVMQKATELGVARITPVVTERSVVRLDAEKSKKRGAHWLRVAQGACEQCGRNTVPVIGAPQDFTSWLGTEDLPVAGGIVLTPDARNAVSASAVAGGRITLLIGPEGGLSDAEREQARSAGFLAASIGPRILRTETAALAAIAILQSIHGDLAVTCPNVAPVGA